jgi:hypothetical protein
VLETRIVTGVRPEATSPRRVERELRELLERGVRIRAAGAARERPETLLTPRYLPRYELRLFDATCYLTDLRHDWSYEGKLRFFFAWVLPRSDSPAIYPRIFSKDYSLVWRSPSHFIRSERENWMGKGEVRTVLEDGSLVDYSAEETTNLPLEIQGALDHLSRRTRRAPRDDRAVGLALRKAPDDRLEPYEDFVAPRRRARANPRNRIRGGRPVAWFRRANDPSSLRFARGYEPDFRRGVLEMTRSASRLYGGEIRKFRILSRNRRIQYQFVAAPRHAWIIPPQALTAELTSYGVRTIDVHAAEELCVPGYEYHYLDETKRPPELHTQIPEGFAGRPSELDPARADASAWLDRLPVIREFRETVLARWRPRGG